MNGQCLSWTLQNAHLMSHHNVCGLDLLLLALRAPHRLLDLHRPPDLATDAEVEEDQAAVGEQLSQQRLAHEIVVHDVELD